MQDVLINPSRDAIFPGEAPSEVLGAQCFQGMQYSLLGLGFTKFPMCVPKGTWQDLARFGKGDISRFGKGNMARFDKGDMARFDKI